MEEKFARVHATALLASRWVSEPTRTSARDPPPVPGVASLSSTVFASSEITDVQQYEIMIIKDYLSVEGSLFRGFS